ncbi:sporulation protein YpjB [Halobacillus rhizosphaerae]|uniref:sporulation protein YpjB n=1 Tax=Halobacillus rhizosphaerae TaxID=3064889 RepID=UPI00398B165E
MGRAVLLTMVTVVFLLMPLITYGQMASKQAEWDSFTTQYRYLINDGKFELAERMLNNRLPEMEQYIETLPNLQQKEWKILVQPLLNQSGNTIVKPADAEPFLFYMETISMDNPEAALNSQLNDWSERISKHEMNSEQLLSVWNVYEPAIQVFYSRQGVSQLSRHIDEWQKQEAGEKEQVIESLQKLTAEHPLALSNDAFIMTAMIIGCSILLTLSYVGLRKFKAEKSEITVRRKSNS